MHKREAIAILAQNKGQAITVSTMQAAAPWHDTGAGKAMHVDASGCMGSASSLGLGLALGRPDRTIMVMDGDGSLLMQLGSLVTVASLAPKNFYHFIFSNGLYESSGNQPLPGQGVFDFGKLALGAGYAGAFTFSDAKALARELPAVMATQGPVLIDLKIARDDATPRWPGIPMAGQVESLRQQLART